MQPQVAARWRRGSACRQRKCSGTAGSPPLPRRAAAEATRSVRRRNRRRTSCPRPRSRPHPRRRGATPRARARRGTRTRVPSQPLPLQSVAVPTGFQSEGGGAEAVPSLKRRNPGCHLSPWILPDLLGRAGPGALLSTWPAARGCEKSRRAVRADGRRRRRRGCLAPPRGSHVARPAAPPDDSTPAGRDP